MKQLRKTHLVMISIFFCIGIIACGTLTAENLRQQGFKVANLEKWTSNTDKALGYFLESLKLDPDNVKALRAAGRLYYIKGNYDNAEEYLQKAIAKDDKDGLFWNNLAWVYWKKEQYSKMRDSFEKAIKYGNGFFKYDGSSQSLKQWNQIGLGKAYYNMQEYDLAEDFFLKVIEMEDKEESRSEAKFSLGAVYYKKGDKNKSERYIGDYIASHTEKHVAYKEVGRFYYTIGELDQAEKYLKKAIEMDNNYAQGWNNLGWFYWKKEEYSKMRDAFEKAVQFRENKEYVFDRIGLGAAFYYLGDYSQATKLFDQVSSFVKNDSERKNLSSFRILLAIKRNDFQLVKKLWNDDFRSLGIHINIEGDEGYIHFVEKEQLGQLAGLKAGDRIIDINGKPLIDDGSLNLIIKKEFNYGQSIDISIRIGNDKHTQKVVLDYGHYLSKTAITVSDTAPPAIGIFEPNLKGRGKIFKVAKKKQLLIKGKAKDESGIYEVYINDSEANVSPNGDFWKEIQLTYGKNQIRVKAIDGNKNIAERSFTVLRESDDISVGSSSKPIESDNRLTGDGIHYALLIGVQDYTYSSVTSLDYPISDAMKVKEVLTQYYTFEEENIIFLKNPDRKMIIRTFDAIAKKLTLKDNLLLFFSGHGYWDKNLEQGYWLPSDATWDDRSGWIENSTISTYLRGIKTQHSLVVSDACFSGSIFKTKDAFASIPKSVEEIYKLPSRKAITSGAVETVPDHSVFVEYFLKKLEQNTQQYLDAQTLYTSIRDAVNNNSPTNQKPLFGVISQAGDEGGEFIFILK